MMTDQVPMAPTRFKVPEISLADLYAFHEEHFTQHSVDAFESGFLETSHATDGEPADEWDCLDDEDDGLGYYEDGVKRTLTDEQIAMFRHSELETLRRAAENKPKTAQLSSPTIPEAEVHEDGEVDEGEVVEEMGVEPKKKKKKRRNGKSRRGEEKPDLRKRTWDIVETGLESLDYDDHEDPQPAAPNMAQRRRISYDDD